ncbi:MAG: YfiR family protein [bacterium]
MHKGIKIRLITAICFFIGMITTVLAQEVPANLQAALFKKIFSFDKTLTAKGSYEVAVLSGSGSGDAIVAALKEVGVSAKSVSGDQVPAGAAVVYIMAGVTPPKAQTASKGVLSITGTPANVEGGKVSIGIGTEGGKPKIIVNLGQLKAEGHEVSADLLKLAKVIK